MELSAITGLPYISIHAPPRGATEDAGVPCDGGNFNSRPSARGDEHPRGVYVLGIGISIHAPPRGATGRAIRDGQPKRFQFTPLREGRPSLHGFRSCGSISIHAPPRGATVYSLPVRCALPISIHAPPRGATAWSCLVCHHCYFNSHPSARGDTKRSLRVCVLLIFQFTPLREGRRSRGHFLLCDDYFNSRPSARGDDMLTEYSSLYQFQFTPLREGRPGGASDG